jgi:transcription elongation factor GreA
MTKLDEGLVSRMAKRAERKVEERITSQRSYNEKKAAYDKLINVDMPENTKRIEFARSYGDLSENAEYQYAKDEQRALLQKQTLMQKDLDEVKPVFFDNVEADEVRAGVMVTVAAAGAEKTYVILGEWDNDPEFGIISCKTKLAVNMIGRKVGDGVELSDSDGNAVPGEIVRVEPLNEDIKAWIRG